MRTIVHECKIALAETNAHRVFVNDEKLLPGPLQLAGIDASIAGLDDIIDVIENEGGEAPSPSSGIDYLVTLGRVNDSYSGLHDWAWCEKLSFSTFYRFTA